jgi:methionine-rich copper-binding protein CopC
MPQERGVTVQAVERCGLAMPRGHGDRERWSAPRPTRSHRPFWVPLVLAVLLGAAVAGVHAAPAHAADNELVVTEPGIRAQVDRPPGFVTMAFSEPVDPSLAKMLVQDAAGTNVTTGELIVEGTNMSSQLVDGLAPGTYTVSYRLARPDGEPQGGTFQFSYGPGAFTDAADRRWSGAAEEPEVLKDPDPNAVSPTPTAPGTSPPGGTQPPAGPSSTGPAAVPTAEPTATASPGPTSGAEPSSAAGTTQSSPAPQGAAPPSSAGPARTWLLVAGVLAAAAVAAAVGLVLSRRRRAG